MPPMPPRWRRTWLASNFVFNTAAYLVAFIIPSQMCNLPLPFDAIQPHIITLVGCLIVGEMHWGLNASWGLLRTKLFPAWFWIVKVLSLPEVESSRTHFEVLSLASRPQVLENWPVLGSRTALFFELLKFCGALEKFFGKSFFVEIACKIFVKTFFFFLRSLAKFLWRPFFFGEHLSLCPWPLASSIPVLGLESVCPRKGCPWPRIFFVSLALASSLVSSTPPLLIAKYDLIPILTCPVQVLFHPSHPGLSLLFRCFWFLFRFASP